MKYLYFIFLIILSGCALDPVIRISNKADWHEKIKSVSIVYLGSKLGTDASYIKKKEFLKIDDEFVKLGIATDTYLYTGLELDGEKKYESYAKKNDYLLIIDPTAKRFNRFGVADHITYQLILHETKKNQKIWIAELSVHSGWTEGVYLRFDEMSVQIVDRLYQDGLVSGPASKDN
jgi:hypothetical protein